MKKKTIIIICILGAILILFSLRFLNIKGSSDCRSFLSGEDCWMCQNDEWVKHGGPSAPKPSEPCDEQQ